MQDKPARPVLPRRLATRLWLPATLPTGFCKERRIQEQPPSLSSMTAFVGKGQKPSELRSKKSW